METHWSTGDVIRQCEVIFFEIIKVLPSPWKRRSTVFHRVSMFALLDDFFWKLRDVFEEFCSKWCLRNIERFSNRLPQVACGCEKGSLTKWKNMCMNLHACKLAGVCVFSRVRSYHPGSRRYQPPNLYTDTSYFIQHSQCTQILPETNRHHVAALSQPWLTLRWKVWKSMSATFKTMTPSPTAVPPLSYWWYCRTHDVTKTRDIWLIFGQQKHAVIHNCHSELQPTNTLHDGPRFVEWQFL